MKAGESLTGPSPVLPVMEHPRVHRPRGAIVLGALSLLVSACGSDNNGADQTAAAGTSMGDGIVSVASVEGHDALVDADGHTLYTAEVEAGGKILCVDACTTFWKPVIGSNDEARQAGTDLSEKVAVVDRPDGETQLTFDGLPLYTFAEEGAGELQGDGFTDDFQGTHFVWAAAWADPSTSSAPSDSPDETPGGRYGY
jgi:predicted lipoprotein with Yx(FWY)xxD motif